MGTVQVLGFFTNFCICLYVSVLNLSLYQEWWFFGWTHSCKKVFGTVGCPEKVIKIDGSLMSSWWCGVVSPPLSSHLHPSPQNSSLLYPLLSTLLSKPLCSSTEHAGAGASTLSVCAQDGWRRMMKITSLRKKSGRPEELRRVCSV